MCETLDPGQSIAGMFRAEIGHRGPGHVICAYSREICTGHVGNPDM